MDDARRKTIWLIACGVCGVVVTLGLTYVLFVNSRSEHAGSAAEPVAAVEAARTGDVEPTADAPDTGPSVTPAKGPETAEVAKIPLTALPLRLLATAVHEDPALSVARIEDLQTEHDQVMTEGLALRDRPNVKLLRIEPQSVLLDNYGVTERLLLDPSGLSIVDGSLAGEAGSPPEMSDEERAKRRELGQRLGELMEEGADHQSVLEVGGLLEDVTPQPLYGEEGELVGVELTEIAPGSLFDAAGLQDGDVVTSINGIRMSELGLLDLSDAIDLSEELQLVVERNDGTDQLLTFPTEEFMRAVAD